VAQTFSCSLTPVEAPARSLILTSFVRLRAARSYGEQKVLSLGATPFIQISADVCFCA
jgi:hypothetical protein